MINVVKVFHFDSLVLFASYAVCSFECSSKLGHKSPCLFALQFLICIVLVGETKMSWIAASSMDVVRHAFLSEADGCEVRVNNHIVEINQVLCALLSHSLFLCNQNHP